MAKITNSKETSEILVTVVADKSVWKEEQKKAFDNLAKDLEVKGFRKGQAPANVVKQRIGQQEVLAHGLTKMLNVLGKEAAEALPEDALVLDSPTYKVEKVSDAELELTFIYPVYPEIKLGDYKSLGIKYEEPKSDKDVATKEIERIRKMQATLETKDGAIAKGDTAVFDYSGSVDGVKFDGGTAEKHSMEIGSGQFIPGFEDQMIGMKAGESKDVKVTFPAEYHSEELKGKDAVFAVKVHEVKVQKLPELNDEFVKSTGVPNVKTVEELKSYIERIYQEQDIQRARSTFQKAAFAKIMESVKIALPAQLVVKEMKSQEEQFSEQMKQQGLSMEQYIKMTGVKPESLQSQFKNAAESRLKESLIFAEIAKAENIELKEADYEAEYIKLAKVYGQTPDGIKGMITMQQMQIPMTNDRVIDALIKYNK